MEVPLELPSRKAQSITLLEGTFEVMIPGQTETFEFEPLDGKEELSERRAGVTVTIKDVRRNDEVDEVAVHIEFDEASNALESHRGWIYKNEAYLVDSDGKRVDHGGKRLLGQDQNSVHIGFLFALDKPVAEHKFVYRTPTLIIRQPMRFELKDIDLP
jgi:hypothetical protein